MGVVVRAWWCGRGGVGVVVAVVVVVLVVVVWAWQWRWWWSGGGDLAVTELQLLKRDREGALLAVRSGAATRGGVLASGDVLAGHRAHDES